MKFLCKFLFLLVGIFAFPVFLANSDTSTKDYTSYARYPWCSNVSDFMRYPTTTDQVVAIVKEAIGRGVKVKAFGSRHSQTDIICTKGIPVDMTLFKSFQMNADGVTATFGAGVTLREAGDFLLLNGRALRTTPAFGNITLGESVKTISIWESWSVIGGWLFFLIVIIISGGALGTGAHGSTLKYNSSISAQVTEVSIVNGLGEVQVISDTEDLRSFKIHLGLLGIVVSITLFTVPLYKVQGWNYVTSDDVLTNGVAMDWAKTTDQITFHWFPSFNEVVVANLTFVPATTPGKAWTNAITPPTYDSFNVVSTKAKEIAYDLTSSSCAAASSLGNTIAHVFEYYLESALWTVAPGFVPIYTEDRVSVKNPAVGYPHLMFSPICSEDSIGPVGEACIWAHGVLNSNITILDNEFGLTFEDLPNFVTTVKDIVKKSPAAFPINGIWLRFSGKSDVYMSTAYQRDSVQIEFPLWKRTNPYKDASGSLAAYQTISQTLTKGFKARSHWGKSGMVYHNRNMLDLKLDPVARQAFVDAMHKFDPNGIFQNNFGRRITKEDSIIDIDPLTTRCALLDNCFCSNNSDCIDTQTCTTLPGYNNYTVCKTKNEVPETQSDKNTFPPMLGVLDWLNNTVPTLASAVLAQCSLQGLINPLLGESFS